MGRPLVHFRIEGIENPTYSQTTACHQQGFNVTDTDLVTCPLCKSVGIYQLTAQRHREVVEMLSSPKEDHRCLIPHPRLR